MRPNPTTLDLEDPLLGQQVGEFRVERMIAAGGMGVVYLMRHVLLPNTRKVLKVILPKLVSIPHVRARFLAEADALSQLGNHPSIVGIDSHMTLPGGQLAIMMPFCDGVPLDEYVERHGGTLSPHRAFYVACHVARGLHHAHMHGIVHRDLKPNNVFVEDDDNDWAKCKLLDFGIARRLNPNPDMPTHTRVGPCGTPDFMPPEQQDRAAEATSAADVYAFGVMLWWMVTGGYPWGKQNDPAILYMRKLNTPPEPAPENTLPPEWEKWLRATLRPEPTERPTLRQLMQGLAQALPAVGRLVLSGPEILQKIARVLAEETGPDDPTLRNPSNRTLQPPWPELDPRPQAAGAPPSQPSTVNARGKVAAPDSAPLRKPRDASAPAVAAIASAPAASLVDPAPDAAAQPPEVATASALAAVAVPSAPGAALVDPAPPSHPNLAAVARQTPVGMSLPAMLPMGTTIGASSGVIISPPSTPSKWKLAIVGLVAVAVAGGGTFAIATLGGRRSGTESPTATQPPPRHPASTPGAPPSTNAPATQRTTAVEPSAAVVASPAPSAPQPSAAATPSAVPAATNPAPAPGAATGPAATPVKRRGGATLDPARSSASKARASTRAADPAGQDKASSDHSVDRRFDPNAAVGGEED